MSRSQQCCNFTLHGGQHCIFPQNAGQEGSELTEQCIFNPGCFHVHLIFYIFELTKCFTHHPYTHPADPSLPIPMFARPQGTLTLTRKTHTHEHGYGFFGVRVGVSLE